MEVNLLPTFIVNREELDIDLTMEAAEDFGQKSKEKGWLCHRQAIRLQSVFPTTLFYVKSILVILETQNPRNHLV